MDDIDRTALADALPALEAANRVAGGHLCADPMWDLVYCNVGLAILVIEAATDGMVAPPAKDIDATATDAAPVGQVAEVAACLAWVQAAAQVLRRADLGSRPGLAVAINAIADAQGALRDVAA